MIRRPVVLLALGCAALGCSSLGEDGVAVSIETLTTLPAEVEINDTITLRARVLDQSGDSIAATLRWRTPDTTIGVDSATGRIWGLYTGTGRVQAVTGSLASAFVTYTVKLRADTLIVAVADEFVNFPVADTVSAPLRPKIAQANETGLTGRKIIVSILLAPPGALLTGNVTVDTVLSGSDGFPAVPIRVRNVNVVAGDSVIVEVAARRISGAMVPGSGHLIKVFVN